jgi:hypothetical protein
LGISRPSVAWHAIQCGCLQPYFAHPPCQLEVITLLYVLCLSAIVFKK